jgi:hypothetical protein
MGQADNLGSTARNQAQSPLLLLPAEMRNTIYDYVLGGYDIKIAHVSHPYHRLRAVLKTDPSHDSTRLENFLAITRTCRQIRAESNNLAFSLNEFGTDVPRLLLASTKLFPIDCFKAITSFRLMVGSWMVLHNSKVPYLRRELKQALEILGTLPHLKQLTIDWTGNQYGPWDELKDSLVEIVQSKLVNGHLRRQEVEIRVTRMGHEGSWARIAETHHARPENQLHPEIRHDPDPDG